jgi:hypothetical protein
LSYLLVKGPNFCSGEAFQRLDNLLEDRMMANVVNEFKFSESMTYVTDRRHYDVLVSEIVTVSARRSSGWFFQRSLQAHRVNIHIHS